MDGYKILIVEDDDAERVAMQTFLSKSYIVETAENGYQAMRYITKSKDFSLVISDIKMPVMDGIKLVNYISKIDSNLPFIIVSNSAYEYVNYKDHYPNVIFWIDKPINLTALMGYVHGIIMGLHR